MCLLRSFSSQYTYLLSVNVLIQRHSTKGAQIKQHVNGTSSERIFYRKMWLSSIPLQHIQNSQAHTETRGICTGNIPVHNFKMIGIFT